METRGLFCCPDLTRDLVSDLAGVWGEETDGGERVKIQGAQCFLRAHVTDFFFPFNEKLCFQLLLTHLSLSPFSPLEDLSQLSGGPLPLAVAVVEKDDSTGPGLLGFALLCFFICLFLHP